MVRIKLTKQPFDNRQISYRRRLFVTSDTYHISSMYIDPDEKCVKRGGDC